MAQFFPALVTPAHGEFSVKIDDLRVSEVQGKTEENLIQLTEILAVGVDEIMKI